MPAALSGMRSFRFRRRRMHREAPDPRSGISLSRVRKTGNATYPQDFSLNPVPFRDRDRWMVIDIFLGSQ